MLDDIQRDVAFEQMYEDRPKRRGRKPKAEAKELPNDPENAAFVARIMEMQKKKKAEAEAKKKAEAEKAQETFVIAEEPKTEEPAEDHIDEPVPPVFCIPNLNAEGIKELVPLLEAQQAEIGNKLTEYMMQVTVLTHQMNLFEALIRAMREAGNNSNGGA